jgi:predicted negative regulator of RcsB-dependent stress response
LLVAEAERQAGQIKEAEATYLDLQSATLTYPLQALASLGLAEIMAATRGTTPAQAAAAFQQAAATFPNSFVAPYARYTEASIFLSEGQSEAAAAGFRAVAADYPTSVLARLSSMQLQRLAPASPLPTLPAASAPTPVIEAEAQATPTEAMPADLPAPAEEAPAPMVDAEAP